MTAENHLVPAVRGGCNDAASMRPRPMTAENGKTRNGKEER